MKVKFTIFLLVLSLFCVSLSFANITVITTSPDNTRKVFEKLTERQILSLTMLFEASTEGYDGWWMVASVVKQRSEESKMLYKLNKIKRICLIPKQFTCFNPNYQKFQTVKKMALNFGLYYNGYGGKQETKLLRGCYQLAGKILNGSIGKHPLVAMYNVKHYVTVHCYNVCSQISGNWICKMQPVARVGNHMLLVETV
jgi:hypothetical protein